MIREEGEDVVDVGVGCYGVVVYECGVELVEVVKKERRLKGGVVKRGECRVIDVGIGCGEEVGEGRVVVKGVDVVVDVGRKDREEVVKE